MSDVIYFIVSANVQGFTSICTHFIIFFTQKPKQRSKDQKQVRVDLQGMNTSLTCLHLSLTSKVKNTHINRTAETHISRDGEVYRSCLQRNTHTHTHTHLSVSVCQCSAGVTWCQTVCGWSRQIKPAGRSVQRSSQTRNTPWADAIPETQELQDMNKGKDVCDWNLSIK